MWHVSRGEAKIGFFTHEELEDQINKGIILKTDLAWCQGMRDWEPISNLEENKMNLNEPPPIRKSEKQYYNPSFDRHCTGCGELIHKKANTCPKCGVSQMIDGYQDPVRLQGIGYFTIVDADYIPNRLGAIFLAILPVTNFFGIHYFYAKYYLAGIMCAILSICGILAAHDLEIVKPDVAYVIRFFLGVIVVGGWIQAIVWSFKNEIQWKKDYLIQKNKVEE
jgi:hypothetical protein